MSSKISPQHFGTTCCSTCHFIAWVLFAVCCPLNVNAFAGSNEDSVSSLVDKLDSGNFVQRESATQKLSQMPEALGEIAAQYFDCSAESAWRLKKIFENIAHHTADEAASVKAIAILVTLDAGQNVNELLADWQKKRSQSALDHLISKGAASTQTEEQRRGAVFERLAVNGSVADKSPKFQAKGQRLTSKQQQQQIRKIVTNSLAENNELVSVAYAPLKAPPSGLTSNTRMIIGGRVWVERNGAMRPISGPASDQVSVTFGKQWTGSESDFRRLKDIHNLYGISFENQQLQPSQLKLLAELNVQHIGLSNTKVKGKRLSSIPLGDNFESISLEYTKIEEPLMNWLSESRIHNIAISNCTFTGEAVNKIDQLEELTNIELKKVRITKAMWEEFAKLKELRNLELCLCKHDKLDMAHFKIRKPGISLRYVPVVFLGVQTNRFNGGPCEISTVIPGTSADRGGIESGDVIKSINGYPIGEYQDLKDQLAEYDVNERILISIKRGEERLDLQIKLGSLKEYNER